MKDRSERKNSDCKEKCAPIVLLRYVHYTGLSVMPGDQAASFGVCRRNFPHGRQRATGQRSDERGTPERKRTRLSVGHDLKRTPKRSAAEVESSCSTRRKSSSIMSSRRFLAGDTDTPSRKNDWAQASAQRWMRWKA